MEADAEAATRQLLEEAWADPDHDDDCHICAIARIRDQIEYAGGLMSVGALVQIRACVDMAFADEIKKRSS